MIKSIWKCDGCDTEIDMTGAQHRHDWKIINLTASGFDGYPTCGSGNLDDARYELCPSCATKLSDKIRPNYWPRYEPARPDPTLHPIQEP